MTVNAIIHYLDGQKHLVSDVKQSSIHIKNEGTLVHQTAYDIDLDQVKEICYETWKNGIKQSTCLPVLTEKVSYGRGKRWVNVQDHENVLVNHKLPKYS